MRPPTLAVLTVLLLPAGTIVHAACSDPAAAVAVRDAAITQCGCETAASHGAFVRCVVAFTRNAVLAHQLPSNCRGDVKRCAARSTCGRAGAVACHRLRPDGDETCSIKADAAQCAPPRGGGSVCVREVASCCDVCPAPTTTTTTTLPAPVLGGAWLLDGAVSDPGSCPPGAAPPTFVSQLFIFQNGSMLTGNGTPGGWTFSSGSASATQFDLFATPFGAVPCNGTPTDLNLSIRGTLPAVNDEIAVEQRFTVFPVTVGACSCTVLWTGTMHRMP